MKIFSKHYLIVLFALFMTGCASTKQFVPKPSFEKPLAETESIVHLKRADHLAASGLVTNVFAGTKLIGELANGEELVWETRANNLECLSLQTEGVEKFFQISLDESPIAQKCFLTQPRQVLGLNYDFMYPETRFARPIAFVPVFKFRPTFSNSETISFGVTSSVKNDKSHPGDLVDLLETAIKKEFGAKIDQSSSKALILSIVDYKAGNAGTRWVGTSFEGSTLLKVKVTIQDGEQIVDEFITKPVISTGGFFTTGGDEYIFDEVAEDIRLFVYGKASKDA